MDKLLVESSEYAARYVRGDMEAMEALPDKLESLRQVIYLSLPLDEERRGNWNFWMGFWERSVRNAAVRKMTHTRYTEWIKRLEHLIALAQEAGDLPDDLEVKRAARMGVALVDGIATQTMRSGFPLSADDQRRMVDDWILASLRPTRALSTARIERPRRPRSNGTQPQDAAMAKAV